MRLIETARNRVRAVVDQEMVNAYWQIGREIVEDEQKRERRAEYGKAVIESLAVELTVRHGKGLLRVTFWRCDVFILVSQFSTHCALNCPGPITVNCSRSRRNRNALSTK